MQLVVMATILAGTAEDKIRLFLINYLLTPDLPEVRLWGSGFLKRECGV